MTSGFSHESHFRRPNIIFQYALLQDIVEKAIDMDSNDSLDDGLIDGGAFVGKFIRKGSKL